jgi:hypothetical protein
MVSAIGALHVASPENSNEKEVTMSKNQKEIKQNNSKTSITSLMLMGVLMVTLVGSAVSGSFT